MREIPVIVCGAGPVGLTTSILLSRQGIEHLVVEKRDGVSTLPRARGIMNRTVEIWSPFGLAEELTAISLPPHWCQRFVYMDTLAGELIGDMPSNCMAPGALSEYSAYDFRCGAQDQIDRMLWRHAKGYAPAGFRFGTELVDHRQDETGLTVTLRGADGRSEVLHTAWLVAADGGKSPLRERAGIQSRGAVEVAWFVNNHFSADLSRWTAGREATLLWTCAPGCVGVFQPLDGKSRWMCQIRFDPATAPLESWTRERVLAQLRKMIGDPAAETLTIELHSTYPYAISACVSERLLDQRLLLVGDAAHRIPPAGGFGMNTGVQSAHNLVWKLAAVLRGEAGPALLGSFDAERREVAARVCDFGRSNLGFIQAIHDTGQRDKQRAAIAASRQYGNWAGLDLGVHYETASGAFIDDGVSAPAASHPVIDFAPCAKPGHRAPHLWLRRGAQRISATDLFEREFVLLGGRAGQPWIDAVRTSHWGCDVKALSVMAGGDLVPERDFEALYGIGPAGAVLVRPDGHVAWRSMGAVADPRAALSSVLDRVLYRA